jgi:hypothetical protein
MNQMIIRLWILPGIVAICLQIRITYLIAQFEGTYNFRLVRNKFGWLDLQWMEMQLYSSPDVSMTRILKKLIRLKKLHTFLLTLTFVLFLLREFLWQR